MVTGNGGDRKWWRHVQSPQGVNKPTEYSVPVSNKLIPFHHSVVCFASVWKFVTVFVFAHSDELCVGVSSIMVSIVESGE